MIRFENMFKEKSMCLYRWLTMDLGAWICAQINDEVGSGVLKNMLKPGTLKGYNGTWL